MIEERQLLSMTELAERLGVSRWTVRNWALERGLPYVKIGNRKRFRPKDVEEWLKKLREKGLIE